MTDEESAVTFLAKLGVKHNAARVKNKTARPCSCHSELDSESTARSGLFGNWLSVGKVQFPSRSISVYVRKLKFSCLKHLIKYTFRLDIEFP